MADLLVSALFTASNAPKTGLTLSDIDIYLYSRNKSTGAVATIWTAQNPTEEVGGGVYTRNYASADFDVYNYFAYAEYTGGESLDSDYALMEYPSPDPDAIADEVWDEPISGHTSAGSFGEEVQDHSLSSEISALNDLSAADVNAEVVDALGTDTQTIPGQGSPTATPTLVQAIMYLYKAFRNKLTQTSTTLTIYADDGTTEDQKATVSDDGSTFTRGEMGTGA